MFTFRECIQKQRVIFMFYYNFVNKCNELKKSPSAVAEEMGFKRSVVTRWKNGTVPRQATLQKIAKYFDCSVEELTADGSFPHGYQALLNARAELALEKAKKPAPDWDRLDAELVERLTALTPGERDKVDAFVQGLLASRED